MKISSIHIHPGVWGAVGVIVKHIYPSIKAGVGGNGGNKTISSPLLRFCECFAAAFSIAGNLSARRMMNNHSHARHHTPLSVQHLCQHVCCKTCQQPKTKPRPRQRVTQSARPPLSPPGGTGGGDCADCGTRCLGQGFVLGR